MSSRPNVIILTAGIAGSSVLASLIARKGYWLGEKTRQVAYETSENARLVELNVRLFRASGAASEDLNTLNPPEPGDLRRLAGEIDLSDFRAFIAECEAHGPWLWKDPRLCYTAAFWQELIDFRTTRMVVMARDPVQAWIGNVIRGRQCVKYQDSLAMAARHTRACHEFLAGIDAEHHELTFEQLISKPARSIEGLNAYLDLDLTVDDLRAVYRGDLFRIRWSRWDYVKAWLRYAYCAGVRGARIDPHKG